MSKIIIYTKIELICLFHGQMALHVSDMSLLREQICANFRFVIYSFIQSREAQKSLGETLRHGVKAKYFPRVIIDPARVPRFFLEGLLKVRSFGVRWRIMSFCFSLEPHTLELYGWQ